MRVLIQTKNGSKEVNLNRRKAIRERCLNCSAWSYKEVDNCEFTDCSLHPFRSGKGKQNATARAKAIRKYCLWCMVGQRKEVTLCPSTDCSLFPYRQHKVDRSVEIKSLPKKGHIEPCFERKTEKAYESMECQSDRSEDTKKEGKQNNVVIVNSSCETPKRKRKRRRR